MSEELVIKKPSANGPKLSLKHGHVSLNHGAGGRAMAQLIDQLFLRHFANPWLLQKNDQASFKVEQGTMVMTTDAHVISPLFFPGGDIGSLSVNGTINDIVMSGAKPSYIAVSFILEEGFPLADLAKIVASMAAAAKQADIPIITGDTKVVERGKADGVFITTTGLGFVPQGMELSPRQIQTGDKVLLSGSIGDHGVAIMSQRENLSFDQPLLSDSCALHDLVAAMVDSVPTIRCMRDPTRGGLAAVMNEWAQQAELGFMLNEAAIPVCNVVQGACELLGLDPLMVANEGKLIAVCSANDAEKLLRVMRQHPQGKDAAIIGEAIVDENRFVEMQTPLGGRRLVDWPQGEQLPRIC